MNLPAQVWAAQLPLREAWYRAEANGGMAGVDGVSVRRFARDAPHHLAELARALASARYVPWPLRLAHVDKKDGGVRQLMVPTVADRIVQGAFAQWLALHWEKRFDDASHGYRPGRGVATALRQLRRLHGEGFRWVLDADIRSFFDSIDHDLLVRAIAESAPGDSHWLPVVRHWLSGPVWDGEQLRSLPRGVPQGAPVSPLLANCYLHGFDAGLRNAGLRFIRYADDFLVLGKTPFDLPEIRSHVEQALRSLGLELSLEKTRFTSFEKHFGFLGAEMQGAKILLPFEKEKTAKQPVFVAPVMAPALRRDYRARMRASHGQSFPLFDASGSTAPKEPGTVVARSSALDALRAAPC